MGMAGWGEGVYVFADGVYVQVICQCCACVSLCVCLCACADLCVCDAFA